MTSGSSLSAAYMNVEHDIGRQAMLLAHGIRLQFMLLALSMNTTLLEVPVMMATGPTGQAKIDTRRWISYNMR